MFDKVSISYSYLKEWLGTTGIVGIGKRSDVATGKFQMGYNRPDRVELQLEKFDIAFHHDFNLDPALGEFHLEERAFVEIKPKQPLSFREYDVIAQHFSKFLTLATNRAIRPLTIKGQRAAINIYVFQSSIAARMPERTFNQGDMDFLYRDVASELGLYLTKWFSTTEELKNVYDLYFSLFYTPNIYSHLAFITVIFALEEFHRKKRNDTYLPKKEYASIQEALKMTLEDVLASISPFIPDNATMKESNILVQKNEFIKQLKDKLSSSIGHGNEFSLKSRIADLLEHYLVDYEEKIIKLVDEIETFAGQVSNIRNGLAHRGAVRLEIDELNILTTKLMTILRVCFLKEIGFSTSLINTILSRTRYFDLSS